MDLRGDARWNESGDLLRSGPGGDQAECSNPPAGVNRLGALLSRCASWDVVKHTSQVAARSDSCISVEADAVESGNFVSARESGDVAGRYHLHFCTIIL